MSVEPASGASAGGTLRGGSAAGTRSAAALSQDELIGLRAKVVASGHAGYVGVEGRVVDETQRTFTLATAAGDKTVPKAGQEFQFTLPHGSTETLEGAALAHRPEERIRKAAPGRRARGAGAARGREGGTRPEGHSTR